MGQNNNNFQQQQLGVKVHLVTYIIVLDVYCNENEIILRNCFFFCLRILRRNCECCSESSCFQGGGFLQQYFCCHFQKNNFIVGNPSVCVKFFLNFSMLQQQQLQQYNLTIIFILVLWLGDTFFFCWDFFYGGCGGVTGQLLTRLFIQPQVLTQSCACLFLSCCCCDTHTSISKRKCQLIIMLFFSRHSFITSLFFSACHFF